MPPNSNVWRPTRISVEGGHHDGLNCVYTNPPDILALGERLNVHRYQRIRITRFAGAGEIHTYQPVEAQPKDAA